MSYGYLHRGRVVELDVTTGGYFVEIQTLAPSRRMGPFPSVVPNLPIGQRIVLASLGTSRDDLVIVGRVPGTAPTIGQIPGLQAALDAKADDTEITALDLRLDAAEATLISHTGTLSTHSGELVSLDSRLDVVEPLVTAHGVELVSQDTRLDVLEAKTGYVLSVANIAGRPGTGLYEGYPIYQRDVDLLFFYDGAAWRVRNFSTVAALADVDAPLTHQVVLLASDQMLYRYTGSAWLAIAHTAAGGGFAKYYRTSAQANAIVAAVWTRQAYNVSISTSADVSPNGSFDQFTLNRTGTWDIRASNRANITNVDPVRYQIGIFPGGTPGTDPYAVETENEPLAASNSTNLTVGVERRFTAGNIICVAIIRTGNSGSGGGNIAATEAIGEINQISMRWVGP